MLTQALQAMTVDTPGGRIHVQWDHAASASPNAQLTFFAEFLAATSRYESWVDSYPLSYSSLNAPDKRDVLGTWPGLACFPIGARRWCGEIAA